MVGLHLGVLWGFDHGYLYPRHIFPVAIESPRKLLHLSPAYQEFRLISTYLVPIKL